MLVDLKHSLQSSIKNIYSSLSAGMAMGLPYLQHLVSLPGNFKQTLKLARYISHFQKTITRLHFICYLKKKEKERNGSILNLIKLGTRRNELTHAACIIIHNVFMVSFAGGHQCADSSSSAILLLHGQQSFIRWRFEFLWYTHLSLTPLDPSDLHQ
jgi:hypothetical protein